MTDMLNAMARMDRCRRLYWAACFRRKGPTPAAYKAVYVRRAAALRELA